MAQGFRFRLTIGGMMAAILVVGIGFWLVINRPYPIVIEIMGAYQFVG